ncbi:MAG: major capsid protein, partial [Pseudomonadales bacterium]|nr:major capsid protein [Pseudomonadales bacterium]
ELAKNVDIWNAASLNTLRMINGDIKGDGTETSFRARTTGGTVVGRDITSTDPKTYNKSTFKKEQSAVSPWKINDIADSQDAMARIEHDGARYAAEVGAEIAKDLMNYHVQTGLSCLAGSIQAVAASVYTDASDISLDTLFNMLQTRGDQKGMIKTILMDSRTATVYDISRVAQNVFQESGIIVYGGSPGTLGRNIIVVDDDVFAKNTLVSGSGFLMGLAENACQVKNSTTVPVLTQLERTLENFPLTTTGEGNSEVMVQGMQYSGAANTTDLSVLRNSTSWTKGYVQDKAFGFCGATIVIP